MKVKIVGRRVVSPYTSKQGVAKQGGLELHYMAKDDRTEGYFVSTQWVRAGTEVHTRLTGPIQLPVEADLRFDMLPGRDYATLTDVNLFIK